MVFNKVLFEKFIQKDGTLLGYSNVVSTRPDLPNKYWIISPLVVETAKQYFNCTGIDGVPLEDYTEPLITNLKFLLTDVQPYWESRWMYGDYMTADKYSMKVISEITLALFEDSGWYKVRYYTGGLFKYGKKGGCNFLKLDCISDSKASFTNEFCDHPRSGICSSNRLERGICQIRNYTSETSTKDVIPIEYQYYGNSTGGHPLVNYCPVSTVMKLINPSPSNGFLIGLCNNGTSLYPIGTMDNAALSDDDKVSMCFLSSLIPKGSELEDFNSGQIHPLCYRVSCNYKEQYYTIYIDSVKTITVTNNLSSNSTTVQVDGYNGQVYIADYSLICSNRFGPTSSAGGPCITAFSCIQRKIGGASTYKTGDMYGYRHMQSPNNTFNFATYITQQPIIDPIDDRIGKDDYMLNPV